MSDVFAKLKAVRDRESFLEFVKELARDRAENAAKEKASDFADGDWQNSTIEAFLEAAVRRAEAAYIEPVPEILSQIP